MQTGRYTGTRNAMCVTIEPETNFLLAEGHVNIFQPAVEEVFIVAGTHKSLNTTQIPSDTVLLETRELTKEFRGFTAVREVSLRVRRGTVHALIGPNGAGKTTLFNLLTGFLKPTSGKIFYEGRDITAVKTDEIARLGMVRSFQISAVFPHLSVLENVRVALQRELGTTFHFWRSKRSLNVLDDRAAELLEEVGLGAFAYIPAAELPYGRKRALEIATTLALNPDMLLLDEPTAGMGQEDIALISELIHKTAQTRTVLMVEHNLNVVRDLSNTITVMQRGAVLAEGSYAEVSQNPEVIEAYVGTDPAGIDDAGDHAETRHV